MEKLALIILDGFGISKRRQVQEKMLRIAPNFASLLRENPSSILEASGIAVGLPAGQMGNSEVGHMNMGAGRTLNQDLVRINDSIRDGSFYENKVLLEAIEHVKRQDSALHFVGLLSDGGVHSHMGHLFALLELAKRHGIRERVYVHAILDGRDTGPKTAKTFVRMLQKRFGQLGFGKISTIMGRFYGMDRDNRWNREHKAYDSMVNRVGRICDNVKYEFSPSELRQLETIECRGVLDAIDYAYSKGETDEFIRPTITDHGRVEEDDAIVFFNFRSDRARELTRAFVQGRFNKFRRKKLINLNFVCLTQYEKDIPAPVAFPPLIVRNCLGEVLSKSRIPQLRAAETEKYAHVTFFFNCGREGQYPLEDRILIPSPMVATYDRVPEMSARKVCAAVLKDIRKQTHRVIIMNLANPDMVGHTGNVEAATKALHIVDECLGKLIAELRRQGYMAIVTADHGNIEECLAATSEHPHTSHSLNKVFCIVVGKDVKLKKIGTLANIAPTILELIGIKVPDEMVESLISR